MTNPLGDFLRARRHVVTLDQVGMPSTGRRRTSGLRREEVAALAGISPDYYTRLEQGKVWHPSDHVVGALAQVLQLDGHATGYLYDLARHMASERTGPESGDQVDPEVQRLMDGLPAPAFVWNRRMDVLAVNPPAAAFFDGLSHAGNLIRLIFLDPDAHDFYVQWEQEAWSHVAHLRAAVGTGLDDPRVRELVEELLEASADFRRIWPRHDVRARDRVSLRIRHRRVGELVLRWRTLTIDESPAQQIVVGQPEPGSPSEAAVRALRELAAGGGSRPSRSGS
ncbi:helix-turn-helix transcriptional regulator [Sphaerisporangium dianthi]|uniref:Helix-turn-helix transcriptional regulator n=1 Tax=Sphaerisporangium dianthi TaxID=1436120 RepID=A0ABV9CBS8_9ACTN